MHCLFDWYAVYANSVLAMYVPLSRQETMYASRLTSRPPPISHLVLCRLNCRQSLPRPGNVTDDTEARNNKLSNFGDRSSNQTIDGGGNTRAASVGQVGYNATHSS